MMRDVARDLGGHVCYYSLGKACEIGEKADMHGTVKTVTTRPHRVDRRSGGRYWRAIYFAAQRE